MTARKSIDPVKRLTDKLNALERRLKAIETGPRLQNSSIDEGALYVLSDEGLIVGEPGSSSGSARVYGLVYVDGRIEIPGATPILIRSTGGQAQIALGGSTLSGYGSAGAILESGDHNVSVTNIEAALNGTSAKISVQGDKAYLLVDALDVEDVGAWLGRHKTTGVIGWVDSATGGPTGSGEFAWPFDLSLVTKEYDPLDPGYDNGHLGIDFGSGIANTTGTPIPAAGNGTVLANAFDSERGWYVILDHGTRGTYALTTRYYHLHEQSPLAEGSAVIKGSSIGGIGSTGYSTGPHLHFETRRNGAAMNPRTFMSIYGE